MAFVASAKSTVTKSVFPAVKKCLLPSGRTGGSAASAVRRSLSTAAAKYRPEVNPSVQDNKQKRHACQTRREDLPKVFSDPFYPLKSLGFGLDELFDDPFLDLPRGTGDVTGNVTRGGLRKPMDALEDKEALRLRVDMPGLGREDVKVYEEENALVINGESLSDVELDGSGRKYISRIDLPPNVYKLKEITAQMKNGVLKITVPKFTEEEIKNVINVKIG